MARFREYILAMESQPPVEKAVVEIHDDVDRSETLLEVSREIFHYFTMEPPVVYPFQETVEGCLHYSDGSFAVEVRAIGENFAAKIRLVTSKDTLEVSEVHSADTPVEDVIACLLESCRAAIYKKYHPDPNMHESQWTRYEWAGRGRQFVDVLDRINSIPRIRRLFISESNSIPTVMYHMTSVKNRQSIMQYGLRQDFDQSIDKSDPQNIGGIFLSSHPRLDASPKTDVWQVDVRGLPIEDDWTTSVPHDLPEDETWYVVYQSISPNRLKLISRH